MRLYNLTMKVNRLELLKARLGLEMVNGFDEMHQLMDEKLTERALATFTRQAGILGKTVREPEKLAKSIVNASFHNARFSDRIWANQDMLKDELSMALQQGLIQGRGAMALGDVIRKRFDVSQNEANRLMITELARVQTEAQKNSFEENGYEEYEFIALGAAACPDCAALDGRHFKVKDMQIGLNAPPMHPNCRCSTAAYVNREALERELFEESIFQTGGKESGGKNYAPYDKDNPRDVLAAKEYRRISRRNDLKIIAKNSGMTVKEIRQIKRHIFFNKHRLYDGYRTLYPDYDMAVAWKRLYEGRPEQRDLLLLRHELLESQLEKEYNLSIAEAHRLAKEKYDWEKALIQDVGELGEADGLL